MIARLPLFNLKTAPPKPLYACKETSSGSGALQNPCVAGWSTPEPV